MKTILCTVFLLHTYSIFAQSTTSVDIVMCINGSGSISSTDFALQLEGISRAVQNEAVFPRDGSRSFGLVQYANRETKVHIGLTTINSIADIRVIIDAITGIQQIRGLTNPGDGIVTAAGILSRSRGAKQVICLSSDGLPNSGLDVNAASQRAKDLGVDQLGVIGFDLGLLSQRFTDIYERAVSTIGKGSVTIALNAVDYADIVGASCIADEVDLIAIEVNQVIQNWNNDVDLIRGKETIVRAFFESSKRNIPVKAKLHAYRGGKELQGSPKGSFNILSEAPENASSDAVRADVTQSLSFPVLYEWMSDDVEFEIRGVSPVNCKDQSGTPNDCRTTVNFKISPQLSINLHKIHWQGPLGKTHRPTQKDADEFEDRLLSIFPISEEGLDVSKNEILQDDMAGNIFLFSPKYWGTINEELKRLQARCLASPQPDCDSIYFGFLVSNLPALGFGQAYQTPKVGSAMMLPSIDKKRAYTPAHEVAHVVGRDHIPACGAELVIPDPNFMHDYFFDRPMGPGTIAAIGNLNGGDQKIMWGYDSHNKRAVNPKSNFELMSSCGPEFRWVSDIIYDRLYVDMLKFNSSQKPATTNIPTDDHIIITGLQRCYFRMPREQR